MLGSVSGQISGQILCASLAWPVKQPRPWTPANYNMNSVRIAALDSTWRGRVPGHGLCRSQCPIWEEGGWGAEPWACSILQWALPSL